MAAKRKMFMPVAGHVIPGTSWQVVYVQWAGKVKGSWLTLQCLKCQKEFRRGFNFLYHYTDCCNECSGVRMPTMAEQRVKTALLLYQRFSPEQKRWAARKLKEWRESVRQIQGEQQTAEEEGGVIAEIVDAVMKFPLEELRAELEYKPQARPVFWRYQQYVPPVGMGLL